jgi:short-subunit dehydrogenase
VVNVSSLAGLVGTYGYTAYAASKSAVIGLSMSLRNELKVDGIDVKVLCPPDTDTPQLAQEELTKPDETRKINGSAGVLTPQKVAAVLLRGLERRRFLILPGFMSRLTWALYRLAPELVHALIDRDVRSVRRKRA